MSTFDRTICLCKEPMKDGSVRIRQLGWEFVAGGISQRPTPVATEGSALAAAKINVHQDMIFDPAENSDIDQVTKIEYYDSEADITNRFDNVTAMYSGNGDNVSGELGYPRG